MIILVVLLVVFVKFLKDKVLCLMVLIICGVVLLLKIFEVRERVFVLFVEVLICLMVLVSFFWSVNLLFVYLIVVFESDESVVEELIFVFLNCFIKVMFLLKERLRVLICGVLVIVLFINFWILILVDWLV